MNRILKGNELRDQILEWLRNSIQTKRVPPKLCVILVWENPASMTYVRNKQKACESIGMAFELRRFPDDISEAELVKAVQEINAHDEIHGCIVQLPLPAHINTDRIIDSIHPEKDVDGFTKENIGKLFLGRKDSLTSCTPKGIMTLLDHYGITVSGKHVVILGRSNIVGKPLALLMINSGATVTVCHSKTLWIEAHTKQADILVVAVGKAKMITEDMVKEWAIVVDVGINRDSETGKLVGDVDFETIIQKADCTPVPGWVGPLTIAMLLENTHAAFQKYGKHS